MEGIVKNNQTNNQRKKSWKKKAHDKVKVFVVVVDIGEQPSGRRKGENSYVKENRNGQ